MLNTVFGAIDILISPVRSFAPISRVYMLTFMMIYAVWGLTIRLVTGLFPYPFMNEGNFAKGLQKLLGLVTAFSVVGLFGHAAGQLLRRAVSSAIV